MRYSLYTTKNEKTHIDRDLSIDDIKILLPLYENDPENKTIGIRPEIELYDIVINKKISDVGEIISVDTDITYFNISSIDDIEEVCGYTQIINSNYDMMMWKVSDLIVIDDSTIY